MTVETAMFEFSRYSSWIRLLRVLVRLAKVKGQLLAMKGVKEASGIG